MTAKQIINSLKGCFPNWPPELKVDMAKLEEFAKVMPDSVVPPEHLLGWVMCGNISFPSAEDLDVVSNEELIRRATS
jgi:hypothetical protein